MFISWYLHCLYGCSLHSGTWEGAIRLQPITAGFGHWNKALAEVPSPCSHAHFEVYPIDWLSCVLPRRLLVSFHFKSTLHLAGNQANMAFKSSSFAAHAEARPGIEKTLSPLKPLKRVVKGEGLFTRVYAFLAFPPTSDELHSTWSLKIISVQSFSDRVFHGRYWWGLSRLPHWVRLKGTRIGFLTPFTGCFGRQESSDCTEGREPKAIPTSALRPS